MGRATIISGGTDGLYTIEQQHSQPGQEAERDALTARQVALATQIAAAQAALTYLQQTVDAAVRTLTEMIRDWQARTLDGKDPDPPVNPLPQPGDATDPNFVNNAASDCLAAHNAIRAGAGLPSYSNNSQLATAAQGHADWLADNNASGHTGAGGSDPKQRILAAGYPWGPGAVSGENQAAGHTSVAAVMDGWMASLYHKENILDTDYQEMGVGYAYRSLGLYRHYWVVNFGRAPT